MLCAFIGDDEKRWCCLSCLFDESILQYYKYDFCSYKKLLFPLWGMIQFYLFVFCDQALYATMFR